MYIVTICAPLWGGNIRAVGKKMTLKRKGKKGGQGRREREKRREKERRERRREGKEKREKGRRERRGGKGKEGGNRGKRKGGKGKGRKIDEKMGGKQRQKRQIKDGKIRVKDLRYSDKYR